MCLCKRGACRQTHDGAMKFPLLVASVITGLMLHQNMQ